MKAYVVWYNSGEPYEDNFQCIERIFSTREKAEAYLADLEKFDGRTFKSNEGFVSHVRWRQPEPKHKCEKVIEAFDENGESHFNTCFDCDKADCCKLEEEYEDWYYTGQFETWEIQEWDMDVVE